ncbi:MAG: hypothetical protein QXD48_03525 [Candidatus Aenigmatarchaeota archaeon]
MKKIISCPNCKSRNFIFCGFRYNENSKKRLRKCKNCRRKFTFDDGFLRMRFDKKDILLAVNLYKKGYSLSEIKKELEKNGVSVSRWTISKWYKKYGK